MKRFLISLVFSLALSACALPTVQVNESSSRGVVYSSGTLVIPRDGTAFLRINEVDVLSVSNRQDQVLFDYYSHDKLSLNGVVNDGDIFKVGQFRTVVTVTVTADGTRLITLIPR